MLPDGTAEHWTHAGLDRFHEDLGGTITRLRYDQALRLRESTRALGSPDEERLCFDYGPFEDLAQVRPSCISPLAGPTYAPGEAPPTIKTFDYDARGNLLASHDPSEGPREFFYNGHGELDTLIDGNGNAITLTRDPLGRVTTREDIDGETTWTYDETFTGALSHSQSPDGHETHYQYDLFGRISTLTKIIAGEPYDLDFSYDAHDRLDTIHYPQADLADPFFLRHLYTETGELQALEGPDDQRLWTLEATDDAGRITQERFGNDAQTQRSYDPLRGFLEALDTTSALGGDLQSLRYQWNETGTLHQREDLLHAQAERFDYDDLHRVIASHASKNLTQLSRHFSYDALGNLAYASDRGEYDYDPLGRLAQADGRVHQWDKNGNLTARTSAGEELLLTYTAFDKPAFLDHDGHLTELEYDADQSRVYRHAETEDGASETIYVTDLYQRHRDLETGETKHHYYVQGPERTVVDVVDTVTALTTTRDAHYLHTDHQGSLDVLSDQAGFETQRLSYDLWGKQRAPTDWTLPEEFSQLSQVNLGYTGHEAQEDAGLIHMQARLYDPHLGRMTSADPFVVDPLSAQGWNRYAYVLNSPLSFTDPTGFKPCPEGEGDPKEPSPPPDSSPPSSPPPRGAEGILGAGEERQNPPKDNRRPGGQSTPKNPSDKAKPGDKPRISQQPGDKGPDVDEITGRVVGGLIHGALSYALDRVGPGVPPRLDSPIQGFTDAMVRHENPSQERRRLEVSQEVGDRIVHTMQNPPEYVQISMEITLIFIGGDVEAVASVVQGGVKWAGRKGGLKVVVGAVKEKGKKRPKIALGSALHPRENEMSARRTRTPMVDRRPV
ncbi:MAG: RHS repeat-associated core domain-containing protein [Acidobacteria bacterium]|nr:RHS repeat-associated core domain-containing protein [Acidobacteriota bacterium]